MKNNKQQTAVEWLVEQLKANEDIRWRGTDLNELEQQAKEMEKEQKGYTKADVIKAGELGEVNHHDTKHIVSYLDEAKQFNETYGGNK